MNIKIKYFNSEMPKLELIEGKSDWIDLRVSEDVELLQGQFKLLPLGVAMELPLGYEAYVVPRSSTYKNYGLLQANSMGVIDESYKGNEDMWKLPVIASKNIRINKYDRVAQFRIQKKMPEVTFEEVDFLDNEDRSGFGSTGNK